MYYELNGKDIHQHTTRKGGDKMKTSIVKAMNLVLIILVGLGITLYNPPMSDAAEKPRQGGTFVVGLWSDPDTLNPMIIASATARMVITSILSKLIYFDLEGNPVGDLAEKWTISKDYLRFKFDLRQGAKWHDGRPVTVEDVKFTLEMMAKYNPQGLELKRISEIRVLGTNSLEVKFPSPSVTFLALLSENGFIIPKHIYGSGGDFINHPANSNPIGSGPFKFQEWRKGDHITLIKNENYYIPGRPYMDKVVFKISSSAAARVLALETGEIDYLAANGLPDVDVPRLRKDPKFVVTDRGTGGLKLNYLLFNTRRKPWDDVRVRRAVAHAIDRQVMAEKGTFGLSRPAYSPMSNGFLWAYNPKVEAMYPQDLAKAAKLLDEAGYPKGPDGVRFKTTVVFDRAGRDGDITEILREQLKKVDIEMVMQPKDKATLAERVWMQAEFDLFLTSTPQGDDPAAGPINLEKLFVTETIPPLPTIHNGNGYSNPEVDKLFRLARTTMDKKERGQYYHEVQPILLRDLPVLPLLTSGNFATFPKKVRGVNEHSFKGTYYAPSEGWFSE